MHVFKFGAMLVRSGGTAADFSLGLVIQSFNAPSAMCTCFVLVYQWFWTTGNCDTLWMITLSLLLVLCLSWLLNRLFYEQKITATMMLLIGNVIMFILLLDNF